MIKAKKQPTSRVTNLIDALQNRDIDGKVLFEQIDSLDPEERAELVAGLLREYKAVCEPLQDVQ